MTFSSEKSASSMSQVSTSVTKYDSYVLLHVLATARTTHAVEVRVPDEELLHKVAVPLTASKIGLGELQGLQPDYEIVGSAVVVHQLLEARRRIAAQHAVLPSPRRS